MLHGLPDKQIVKLQLERTQNSAARLVSLSKTKTKTKTKTNKQTNKQKTKQTNKQTKIKNTNKKNKNKNKNTSPDFTHSNRLTLG